MPPKYRDDCSVEGCAKPFYGLDLCNMHYQRKKNGNPLDASQKYSNKGKKCKIENCDRDAKTKGMCSGHYQRVLDNALRNFEDPIGPYYRSERTKPGYIMVLEPNHPNSNRRGWIAEHRLVMSKHLGRPLRNNELIHHKNGDTHNNRVENLELCLRRQPPGQRVTDMVKWAKEIIYLYDIPQP